jgi:hypothetical protein
MYLSLGSPEVVQAAHALELATRDHLKGLRDWNFHWLLGCTFAVGVGLLMELPEIVHDMSEIYGRKSRELKYWLTPSMDRSEFPRRDWVKKWSALGWVLIVLGVMGEGCFEAQVSKYDSALSNLNESLVAETQQEAALAIERASRIEQENIKLRTALTKLRRSSGWRYLSPQEQEELVKALGKYPIPLVMIEFKQGEEERKRFVGNFKAVFDKLHWRVSTYDGNTSAPAGITIAVLDPSKPPPAALALKSALENLDFPFFPKIDKAIDAPGTMPPDFFEVLIGENPQTP